MPMQSIILPYTNPDLDGVACAVALAHLELNWVARVIGQIDQETRVVLAVLEINSPPPVTDWKVVRQIWLVDTHHPKQLPPELPNAFVVRITDHHPGGEPERYPNATIQNELVGAAATLVYEKFERANCKMPCGIALLLQAAIASNTLNFRAAATTTRDRKAFDSLRAIQQISDELLEQMQRARSIVLGLDTPTLLRTDFKSFQTASGTVAIAQVEAPGALEVLGRQDLSRSLREFAVYAGSAFAVLNLVDTLLNHSAIMSTHSHLAAAIASGLGESVCDDGSIRTDRLLQRKTDIVPYIT